MLKLTLPLCLLFLGLGACASSQVNLFTNPPQAKVYAKPLGQGKRVLVGETPMTTSAKALGASAGSTGPLLLEFEKDGFETKSLVLSDLNVNNLLLNIEMQASYGLADQSTMNWLIENGFEVQRLAKAKRLDEAMKILTEMKRIAPQVAVTHEMMGGIFYVRRQFENAFDSYSQALKLNPKSSDALRMTSLLRGMVRSREPSSLPTGDHE